MMQMTTLQAMIYTIGFPVGMLLIGFIMGRLSRPVVYHGHIERVPDDAKQKEVDAGMDKINAVHKAFGRRGWRR